MYYELIDIDDLNEAVLLSHFEEDMAEVNGEMLNKKEEETFAVFEEVYHV